MTLSLTYGCKDTEINSVYQCDKDNCVSFRLYIMVGEGEKIYCILLSAKNQIQPFEEYLNFNCNIHFMLQKIRCLNYFFTI